MVRRYRTGTVRVQKLLRPTSHGAWLNVILLI